MVALTQPSQFNWIPQTACCFRSLLLASWRLTRFHFSPYWNPSNLTTALQRGKLSIQSPMHCEEHLLLLRHLYEDRGQMSSTPPFV